MTLKTSHKPKTLPLLAAALLPLMPNMALADWTGGYAGGSISQLNAGEIIAGPDSGPGEATINVDSDPMFGGHAGYQMQQGNFVYGGELAFTLTTDTEFSIDGADQSIDTETSIIDLKARAGYAIENALVYGVLGVSKATSSVDVFEGLNIDLSAEGVNFGIGADYMITDQFVVGAEYLARRMTSNAIEDTDVNADTFGIRASFKF